MSAIGVSVLVLFFVITCTWIGFDVKTTCQSAKEEYGGDCTEALSSLLDDENRGFKARNSAIWALGQLGDKKALPVLESYYTGVIPEREPLSDSISQYELKKAIKLASGGINITSLFWKYGIEN
ncbi:HEAT repeat domain-containing protein [Candidatus Woesebacteria bacterium]|nr:MAG: HEAT repeat domain-containing protein [Candidatus Woesebacteria bacterium]